MQRVIKIKRYKRYPPLHIGDTVIVEDPDPGELYQHSFIGTVVAVGRTLAMVKDQEGEVFDIDRDKIKKLEDFKDV